jgi:riboflavin kinase/FMN adenylyltransferase
VNLTAPPKVLVPSHGVYATRVFLPDGSSYMGVTNVGTRPTVANGNDVTVETWLLDFDGDLYGQSVRVEFFTKLRDEIRFDSLDSLKRQIALDADATRKYCAEHFIINQ